MVFVSDGFLNAPEFANVFIMYNMFTKRIRISNNEKMIQNWDDVQDLLDDRIASKARLEALRTKNVLEVLTNLAQID
jgi:serine/threonine protein kinase HipA of HipAB toxin-antitoxin module